MNAESRRRTVEAGYDELAPDFGDWMRSIEREPSSRFLAELEARLAAGSRIVDLGCGDGRTLERLAASFAVVGVDLSEQQLRRARAAVPAATFVRADFAGLELPAESVDAVIALYSVIHVPRDEHRALFERIRGWLRPGGLFLVSLSRDGEPNRTEKWLGVEMFFSGFDAETNRRLVREAEFELIADEVVSMREPTGETGFFWVLARKPA